MAELSPCPPGWQRCRFCKRPLPVATVRAHEESVQCLLEPHSLPKEWDHAHQAINDLLRGIPEYRRRDGGIPRWVVRIFEASKITDEAKVAIVRGALTDPSYRKVAISAVALVGDDPEILGELLAEKLESRPPPTPWE